MPGLVLSTHRIAALAVAFFFVSVFIYSAASIHHGNDPVQQLRDTASGAASGAAKIFRPKTTTTSEAFLKLYESIRTEVDAPTYKDASGRVYEINEEGPWWKKPLRNEICVVDIDTRVPDGKNELWNGQRMDWKNMSAEHDGGMVSASFMNHFLYCKNKVFRLKVLKADQYSANSRLRLSLLQRERDGVRGLPQHMGQTTRPHRTFALLPLRSVHRRRRNDPESGTAH
jgi:hypothetical protein